MAWWQNFTLRARKTADPVRWPLTFDLLPGRLTARVQLTDLDSREGPIRCWTYATNGLHACGQKELIFSLRCNPKEAADRFPRSPLEFFTDVYGLAEQGRLVDVGDFTEMSAPTFLDHKGLLYIEPEPSQNFENRDAALAAILLTEEELEAVKAFGPTRVMARLGEAHRYYPCPPWSDRRRRSISFAQSLQESILTNVERVWMRGIRVRGEGDDVVLRLLPRVREPLRDRLEPFPPNASLALLTNLDPSAHGCLVWQPGQSQPAAITPPDSDGTRLCGCFILFVPEQPNDSGRLFEDGYAVMLTSASWTAIRRAVAAGEGISIPASEPGMGFRLEWIQTSYHNPVDQRVYQTDEGWETYVPTGTRHREDAANAVSFRVVLLSSERDVGARVGSNALAAYVRGVEDVIARHFTNPTPADGQDLIAQFELPPDGNVAVVMASRPGIDRDLLANLHASLLALPTPKISEGPIKFQVVVAIWGGSKDAKLDAEGTGSPQDAGKAAVGPPVR